MNIEEQEYLNLLDKIITQGSIRKDRTGVGTRSLFGTQLRFLLKDNTLPLITTKKTFVRGTVEELLFFIRGQTNTKLLEAKGVNIWKGNTSREFLDKKGLFYYAEGNMGPMYGENWRNFEGTDQLKNILKLIKTDPMSRRIMVTAYNPSKSHLTVLDPCHPFFQFYIDDGKLSCMFTMRSSDFPVGFPINLSSYAILTHLFAKASGLKPGELIFSGGDTHVYLNHIDQVKEQIQREPFEFPKLNIKKEISTIEDMEKLEFSDFEIIDYKYHPAIKYEMAI